MNIYLNLLESARKNSVDRIFGGIRQCGCKDAAVDGNPASTAVGKRFGDS